MPLAPPHDPRTSDAPDDAERSADPAAGTSEDAPSPEREPLTREAVVAATRALIIDEGLAAVSLRRIAASLGVTAPALYAYVTDKRDLMRAVAEFEFGRLIARFEAVEGSDPVERTRRTGRAYIEHAVENPELFRTMFLFPPDIALGSPADDVLPLATRAFEVGLTAITEAIETGAFRSMDPAMAALTMWTAAHGCADVLLLGFTVDDTARDALIDSVLDTTIAGLRATP
jgi:AcrR family transcriptional regulator